MPENEPPAPPEDLREGASRLFRRSAKLRQEAEELAKRAAELLKRAGENKGGSE
jgi:hypothetical protein